MRATKILFFLAAASGAALFSGCDGGKQGAAQDAEQHSTHGVAAEKYTCPMHPQVVREGPGTCPVCGMDLVKQGGASSAEGLMLSNTQMKLANITTGKVKRQSLALGGLINARLAVDETAATAVSARVAGRIDRLFVRETGRPLKQGQPVFSFYSEKLVALQKEYLVALEQFHQLGDVQPRYREIAEGAAKKLVLYGMHEKAVEELRKTGKASEQVIFYSPVAGNVSALSVTEGQYVEEGQLLLQVEDTRSLWVEAELYPEEGASVRPGDAMRIRVNGFSSPVTGKVSFISPDLRAGSQLLLVRAQIANPQGLLKPGMQAQVFFDEDEGQTLAVPQEAVIRGGAGAHVYVMSAENTFVPRQVKTGAETSRSIEILGGLHEGEEIAFTGAYLIYSEFVLKKGVSPVEHNH